MNPSDLVPGLTYFTYGYQFRHLPIPEIEAWVYVGVDGNSESFYIFQDPPSFYPDEWLAEVPEGEREPSEKILLRLALDNLDQIHALSELEQFIASLQNEPASMKTYGVGRA